MMVDSQPIQNGIAPIQGAEASKSTQRANSGNGPAFESLLEKLQAQAQGLRATSDTIDAPTELAGAVDMARTTLNDALSLSEQLLEAYRAAQGQDEAPTEG